MKAQDDRLPGLDDLNQMRIEISRLTERECAAASDSQTEVQRQLSEIRNLFRVIRSEVLELRHQRPVRQEQIPNFWLFENWSAMKESMRVAESCCD